MPAKLQSLGHLERHGVVADSRVGCVYAMARQESSFGTAGLDYSRMTCYILHDASRV